MTHEPEGCSDTKGFGGPSRQSSHLLYRALP